MVTKSPNMPKGVNYTNKYELEQIVGKGTFGIVHIGKSSSGKTVAIKKVLQDIRFKNRELSMMKDVRHPNIIELVDYYYTESTLNDGSRQRYLNVVMEYVPDTVHNITLRYHDKKQQVPLFLIKIYLYQLCRAIGYLHVRGICHRDVKPQNLLVYPSNHKLKLCDFGSSKRLVKGEWSVAYICSRYYRAPELILGANEYTTTIDCWSIGCVVAELFIGKPFFPGESGIDQLVKIIQILGTPNRDQMKAMNPNYSDFSFPDFPKCDLINILPKNTPKDAIDFMEKFLIYNPTYRIHPLDALSHRFFDDIRNPPDEYKSLIDETFFQFTDEELKYLNKSNR